MRLRMFAHRRRVPPEPVAVDTRSNSLDAKKRPDVMIGQKSRDATPSDEDVTPQQDVTSRDDVTSPDEPPAAAEEPSGSEETTGEGEIVQQTTKTLFDINVSEIHNLIIETTSIPLNVFHSHSCTECVSDTVSILWGKKSSVFQLFEEGNLKDASQERAVEQRSDLSTPSSQGR